jgi:hypothetical protein
VVTICITPCNIKYVCTEWLCVTVLVGLKSRTEVIDKMYTGDCVYRNLGIRTFKSICSFRCEYIGLYWSAEVVWHRK